MLVIQFSSNQNFFVGRVASELNKFNAGRQLQRYNFDDVKGFETLGEYQIIFSILKQIDFNNNYLNIN